MYVFYDAKSIINSVVVTDPSDLISDDHFVLAAYHNQKW